MDSIRPDTTGEDIISRLPDDVLSRIISCLEAEEAVRTSILSSRWSNIWPLIHNLRFNLSENYRFPGNRATLFVDFVERVIRLSRSQTIHDFSICTNCYLQDSDLARLRESIGLICKRDVRTLTLHFNASWQMSQIFRLPQSILTCKSLAKLRLLFHNFVVDIPESVVCFPSLKVLSIHVECRKDNFIEKLVLSCPILEELEVYEIENEIDIDIAFTFNITSTTLKKLTLDLSDFVDTRLNHSYVVRACKLEYLRVSHHFIACVVVGETPFLNKVILDGVFDYSPFIEPSIEDTHRRFRAIEFFRSISSTRFLSMSPYTMYTLSFALFGNLPMFPNLKCLDFGYAVDIGPALLLQFLQNSSNLEVLVVHKDIYDYFEVSDGGFKFEIAPSCLSLHLKEICFTNIDDEDLEVVKSLMENSRVLERFSVNFIFDTDDEEEEEEEEQEVQKEILSFPRASTICQVEFLECFEEDSKNKFWSEFHEYR